MAVTASIGQGRMNILTDKAKSCVLITGGSGYLGNRIARRYLQDTDSTLVLWLHAKDSAEFESKKKQTLQALEVEPCRARFAWGDLADPDPFNRVNAADIDQIIHAAAVTRFNVEQDLAQKVNIEGAEKLYQFAARCQNLRAVGVLSSIYACGLTTGCVGETPFDSPRPFANYYEWSKSQAEALLLDQYAALPWKILRIATVIADNEGGRVTQQNAFHNTLKLLYYGLMSVVPGNADTPLYFVTGDFVADAVYRLMQQPSHHTIYHVCHDEDHSLTLGKLIDLAYNCFEQDVNFKKRRLLKPLFCDSEAFALLSEGVNSFGGAVVSQGLSSVTPFARQLFSKKTFHNHRLRADYENYVAPDAVRLLQNTCQSLINTRWGLVKQD